jgi:zinc protease
VAEFSIWAIANPENMPRVETAIAEELARFLKDGVTDKEVEDARKAYLAAARNGRSSDGALSWLLLDQLRSGRTSEFLAEFEKRIGGMTAEQVNEAFRKHVDPKRLVIVTAGDFKKK